MNIHLATEHDFKNFFIYLGKQLSENGQQDTALFQPLSRSQSILTPELEQPFRNGLQTAFGHPGWRLLWIALDEHNNIAGHIDIRAHPEQHTEHRALLGMGVDSHYRRQSLGKQLIDHMLAWVKQHTQIEYIDLWLITSNQAAHGLYLKTGFEQCGEINDMFRIDGQSVSYRMMSKQITD